MKNNKFICRGITKDNEFVYGYYAEIEERHFIFTDDSHEGGGYMDCLCIYKYIEITQEPDKFCRKINGKKLWENDKIKDLTNNKIYKVCFENFDWIAKNSKEYKGLRAVADNIKIFEKKVEIIGNTHNIKDIK